jgi:hypothetical protein
MQTDARLEELSVFVKAKPEVEQRCSERECLARTVTLAPRDQGISE